MNVLAVRSAGCSHLIWYTALLGCVPTFIQLAPAQSFYGSIQGAAIDKSGAVIPGVDVTRTNLGTNGRQAAKNDNNGNYRFLNLIPGQYSLAFEKAGFEKFERSGLTLDVQAALRVDAAMQIGQATQTVEVATATPLLDTEDANVSQVVEAAVVQDTPINGRNVDNLIQIVPGAIPLNQAVMATTNNGNGGSGTGETNATNYSIGGGAANQNSLVLNPSTPAYAFGTAPRQYGGVRAQGVDNYDLALAKKTNLAEGAQLELRFEGFNLFNHPQFTAPGTALGSGSFGQITSTVSSQLNSHA